MANFEHVARFKEGVEPWNDWRKEEPEAEMDLSGAVLCGTNSCRVNLNGVNLKRANLIAARLCESNLRQADLTDADMIAANLSGADLRGADLRRAHLHVANLGGANLGGASRPGNTVPGADLRGADLRMVNFDGARLALVDVTGADLSWASLRGADLSRADLRNSNLSRACLEKADLRGARIMGANLAGADLSAADLFRANLSEADLSEANLKVAKLNAANLTGANLSRADLRGADLRGAELMRVSLLRTNLDGANLTGCSVYGISVWDVRLEGAIQSNLMITPWRPLGDKSAIQVDNLEMAQFIYLLLNNEKIRSAIDTITSKMVLILGRFTPERIVVLEAIREQLRERDYLPVLFDFEKPGSQTTVETISTLAHMARFVIADLTDAKSVLQELQAIVPLSPSVVVQPLLLAAQEEPGMFDFIRKFPWVLDTHRYPDARTLLLQLKDKVITPAEAKSKELALRKE